MKRDFIFVWGADVQPVIATLSAPKITQLRASCDELIARAEHYRQDQSQLVRLAEMPHLIEKDLPWSPFEKFGYWFKLAYRDSQREYVLNLAPPPASTTPAERPSARKAAAVRRRDRVRKRPSCSTERVARLAAELHDCAEALYGAVWPRLSDSLHYVCAARASFITFVGVLARSCTALHARLRRTIRAPALQPAAAYAHQAWLEPRLMGREAGLTLLIYTLVRDDPPIDWSADLFGPPAQEASRTAT